MKYKLQDFIDELKYKKKYRATLLKLRETENSLDDKIIKINKLENEIKLLKKEIYKKDKKIERMVKNG